MEWNVKSALVRCGAIATALVALLAPAVGACTGDCDADGQVLVDEIVLGVGLALGTAPTSSCFAYDRNFDDVVTVDEILDAVGAALEGCPTPQTTAFVIATNFETGSFTTVDLASRQVELAASPARRVNADAIARQFGERVYVVNRFGLMGDSVQARDPASEYAVVWDCSTGAGSNPQDIAFTGPEKAYVALLEERELLVIDPSVDSSCAGFVRGTIDLSAYADPDGIPEMGAMTVIDGLLYVTLQRLDRNDLFAPAGRGVVVVIDTATDAVLDAIEMAGENPFSRMVQRGNRLWISSVGQFTVRDAGIEAIDLETRQSLGFVVTEEALGGDITDFVVVAEHIGYAVVSGSDFSNSLVEFAPETGTVTRTLIGGSRFIAQVQVTDRGELYVSDRSATSPGLRVYGVRDGIELPGSPLDLGLPPFDVTFLR